MEVRSSIAEADRTFEHKVGTQLFDFGVLEGGSAGRGGAHEFGFEAVGLLLQAHRAFPLLPRVHVLTVHRDVGLTI